MKADGILITGGTGFLGRALVKRLLEDPHEIHDGYSTTGSPARICVYSRNEHAQAKMFEDFGRHPRLRMFIGDVRDRERLFWAMRSVTSVIHAAALKRIEVGHYNPTEMVRTNIEGSMNVVAAVIASDVSRAVLVSSDKAFQPVSPYGISKAMAEAIFTTSNNTAGHRGPAFSVCRYGNVAGSTGSVIPAWRARIAAGAPLTISDPDCTRFWMTATEAVELVLSAFRGKVEARTAKILIPKLPAFRLHDLLAALCEFPDNLDIHCTGLGAWEKKHETLEEGASSDTARRMSVEELREALESV